MISKKSISGFTLIELLVVLSVIAILSTLGYANYRAYSRTKSVDIARKQIISDLRLAKGWALSGKKPGSGCDILEGYSFERIDSVSYKIQAFCSNGPIAVGKENVSLPENTQFDTGAVTFKTIGEGTTLGSDIVMTISSTVPGVTATKTVSVSTTGSIK